MDDTWVDRATIMLHTQGRTLLPWCAPADLTATAAGNRHPVELMRESHEQALDNSRKLLTIIAA